MPSLTQPDLAMSVKQLYEQYSVGMLPTIAQLQSLYETEEDEAEMLRDDVELDSTNDLRFQDRADATAQALFATKISREIASRFKKIQKWKKEHQQKQKVNDID